MGNHLKQAVLNLGIVAVLILAGCATPKSTAPHQENTDGALPPQELPLDSRDSEIQDAPGSDGEDVRTSAAKVGMGLLENLGYDTSLLEVISMELMAHDYLLVWIVKIGNELGVVAEFNVNEDTLRFEFMSFIIVRDGVLAPEDVSPDESLPGRIAEALGLEEEGYQFAFEGDDGRKYLKYATWDGWQIAVSHVVIVVPPEEDVPILMEWSENELMQPVLINIDRDAAVTAALSYLDDSTIGTEPSNVELIQLPSEPYGPTDFRIYWEVVFGDQTVYVRADNGTIRGAS